MIKTPKEITAIEATQHVTEMAFLVIKTVLKESEIKAGKIIYRGTPLTSEYVKERITKLFARHDVENKEGIIISCGKDSAEPHNQGTGILKANQPIVCDIYPVNIKTGYFADMSRTFVKGKPSAKAQKMYDAILDAQKMAIKMIKPKVKCADIQDAVDTLFLEKGFKTSGVGKEFKFAEGFVHSVGHGIGRSVHEKPRIGRGSTDVLKAGMIVTVEPGLYYKDVGGIRIEDMVLITKTGCRNLTRFSKTFIIP
jgi:Xaa-Pro aminopeptidase